MNMLLELSVPIVLFVATIMGQFIRRKAGIAIPIFCSIFISSFHDRFFPILILLTALSIVGWVIGHRGARKRQTQ